MKKIGKRKLAKILCQISNRNICMKDIVYEYHSGIESVRSGVDSIRYVCGVLQYRHFDMDAGINLLESVRL